MALSRANEQGQQIFKVGTIIGLLTGLIIGGSLLIGMNYTNNVVLETLNSQIKIMEMENENLQSELSFFKGDSENGSCDTDYVKLEWMQVVDVTKDNVYIDLGTSIFELPILEENHMDAQKLLNEK